MRNAARSLLVALLAPVVLPGLAVAQDGGSASPPPPTKQDEGGDDVVGPVLPPLPDIQRGEEAERTAMSVLERAAVAYREAPAFTDTVNVEQIYGGRSTLRTTVQVQAGAPGEAQIKMDSSTVTATGGRVYVEMAAIAERYIDVPLNGDLLKTLRENLQVQPGMAVHLRLRYDKPFAEVLHGLSFGIPTPTAVTGYRRIVDLDGRELDQVVLDSDTGTSLIDFDPETGFIVSAKAEYAPRDAPVQGFTIEMRLKFDPKEHDALPEPLSFTPGPRRAVADIKALRGDVDGSVPVRLAVGEGDRAPGFSARTLDGILYDLGERLAQSPDQVVVLVFWSTRNVTSRRELPVVDEFATWAHESRLPIEVRLVATDEQIEDPSELWEHVFDAWSELSGETECILDVGDEVAGKFGVDAVPVTVVINAKGFVQHIRGGIGEGYFDTIQFHAEQAIRNPVG